MIKTYSKRLILIFSLSSLCISLTFNKRKLPTKYSKGDEEMAPPKDLPATINPATFPEKPSNNQFIRNMRNYHRTNRPQLQNPKVAKFIQNKKKPWLKRKMFKTNNVEEIRRKIQRIIRKHRQSKAKK